MRLVIVGRAAIGGGNGALQPGDGRLQLVRGEHAALRNGVAKALAGGAQQGRSIVGAHENLGRDLGMECNEHVADSHTDNFIHYRKLRGLPTARPDTPMRSRTAGLQPNSAMI
ncbi:Uncharacterised protein [Bordetella pertussis]|nr:Uncharacterised protein [Bordetella pertussis]